MQQVGLWLITDGGPRKLTSSAIALEQHLEDWIERDPGLLEAGLTIVGRQITVEAGPLDLLALDPQGRWVVIELKKGTLYRETLAQALDYAACIASMPYAQLAEKVNNYLAKQAGAATLEGLVAARGNGGDSDGALREVRVYLVGISTDPGLARLQRYLSSAYDFPISIVTYEVFEIAGGQRVLLRELTEVEMQPPVVQAKVNPTVEEVAQQADAAGIGPQFRAILAAAVEHGLYSRPFKRSVMYAPPVNHARCLFTVWTQPRAAGELTMWVGPEIFAQFFPLTESEVVAHLGNGGWSQLSEADVAGFIRGLNQVFCLIKSGHQENAITPSEETEGV